MKRVVALALAAALVPQVVVAAAMPPQPSEAFDPARHSAKLSELFLKASNLRAPSTLSSTAAWRDGLADSTRKLGRDATSLTEDAMTQTDEEATPVVSTSLGDLVTSMISNLVANADELEMMTERPEVEPEEPMLGRDRRDRPGRAGPTGRGSTGGFWAMVSEDQPPMPFLPSPEMPPMPADDLWAGAGASQVDWVTSLENTRAMCSADFEMLCPDMASWERGEDDENILWINEEAADEDEDGLTSLFDALWHFTDGGERRRGRRGRRLMGGHGDHGHSGEGHGHGGEGRGRIGEGHGHGGEGHGHGGIGEGHGGIGEGHGAGGRTGCGGPLGFGSRENDKCLRDKKELLSEGCRVAIDATETLFRTNHHGGHHGPHGPGDSPFDDILFMLFMLVSLLVVVCGLQSCLSSHRNQRRMGIRKLLANLEANPELKAVIEDAAGTPIPVPGWKHKMISAIAANPDLEAAVELEAGFTIPSHVKGRAQQGKQGSGCARAVLVLVFTVLCLSLTLSLIVLLCGGDEPQGDWDSAQGAIPEGQPDDEDSIGDPMAGFLFSVAAGGLLIMLATLLVKCLSCAAKCLCGGGGRSAEYPGAQSSRFVRDGDHELTKVYIGLPASPEDVAELNSI